jgi:hypothetical protein
MSNGSRDSFFHHARPLTCVEAATDDGDQRHTDENDHNHDDNREELRDCLHIRIP